MWSCPCSVMHPVDKDVQLFNDTMYAYPHLNTWEVLSEGVQCTLRTTFVTDSMFIKLWLNRLLAPVPSIVSYSLKYVQHWILPNDLFRYPLSVSSLNGMIQWSCHFETFSSTAASHELHESQVLITFCWSLRLPVMWFEYRLLISFITYIERLVMTYF